MEDIYILAISAGQLSCVHVTIPYCFLWAVVTITVHFFFFFGVFAVIFRWQWFSVLCVHSPMFSWRHGGWSVSLALKGFPLLNNINPCMCFMGINSGFHKQFYGVSFLSISLSVTFPLLSISPSLLFSVFCLEIWG